MHTTFDSMNDGQNISPQSFWRRQFSGVGTQPQLIFDVVFGLVAPVLCFYFDPIVFKADIFGPALYQPYQLFAYMVSAVGVSILAVWLLFGSRLGKWSRPVGGALIGGSLFSIGVGFAILPFSLMGLMIGIGILGFIPFLTGLVYLRTGWRALQNDNVLAAGSFVWPLLAGAIVAIALPGLLAFYVSRTVSLSVDAIVTGDAQQAELAVANLRRIPFVPEGDLGPIVETYRSETDPSRKAVLKNSYRALTGEDIEARLAILDD